MDPLSIEYSNRPSGLSHCLSGSKLSGDSVFEEQKLKRNQTQRTQT